MIRKPKPAELELLLLLLIDKRFNVAVVFGTFRRSSRFQKNNHTASSYNAKLIMVKMQTKTHFLVAKDPVSIIGMRATFKHICGTKNIYEGAAKRGLAHYLQKSLANLLNSCTCA